MVADACPTRRRPRLLCDSYAICPTCPTRPTRPTASDTRAVLCVRASVAPVVFEVFGKRLIAVGGRRFASACLSSLSSLSSLFFRLLVLGQTNVSR